MSQAHVQPMHREMTGSLPARELKLSRIDLEQLRCSPFNTRHVRSSSMIENMVACLESNGQKNPITVYPGTGADAGVYFVLGGETRRLGAQQLGWRSLDALVDFTVDPTDVCAVSHYSTLLNQGQHETDLDRAISVLALSNAGKSLSQIAEALVLDSRTTAQRLLRMAKLPAPCIDLGRQFPDRFSSSLAAFIYEAHSLYGEQFALELLERGLHGRSHKLLGEDVKRGPTFSPVSEATGTISGKRKRREVGFDVSIGGSSTGRYDLFKSPAPGIKAVRFSLECDEAIADRFHEEFQRWLAKFRRSKSL